VEGVWRRCALGGDACVAAGELLCGGCSALLRRRVNREGGGSVAVMVSSRLKRDRSGSALVDALPGLRRRCGLLDDAWCMAARSSLMGMQGPLCSGIGGLHGGGCGAARFDVEDYLGARRHIHDAASMAEGTMYLGFVFSLGGWVVPGSL
jgi:hypothetical protein